MELRLQRQGGVVHFPVASRGSPSSEIRGLDFHLQEVFLINRREGSEARVGIDPTHKSFADLVVARLSPSGPISDLKPTGILPAYCPPNVRLLRKERLR